MKAIYLNSKNDRPGESLSEQMVILARHCLMTGRYFER